MQAAVINVLGQPPKFETFRDPEVDADEMLVEVRAAGLHPIVRALASGEHYAGGGEFRLCLAWMAWACGGWPPRVLRFVRKPWGTMAERAAALQRFIPLPDEPGRRDRPRPLPTPACRRGLL